MGSTISQPWREMPKNNRENLDFVKTYQPRNADVQHLRVLLHGPVGAGKSSFINSVDSVLRHKITGRALADGNLSEGSFTKKYKNYRFTRQSDPNSHYCISINDIVGLEEGRGAHVDDIILALKGHVRDGYEFNPSSPLKEGDKGYNPSPTLQDRVHVLVSVVSADGAVMLSDVMVNKMRKIRRAASDMGIPQLAIITKGDIACPAVKDNVENLYKSKYLKQKFDGLCVRLGIPSNCVFLVKNYDKETSPKDDVDAPILCALRQIISVGDNFLRAVIGQTFSQPWREMPANNRGNLDYVKTYQPRNTDVQHLRVLLHGPVGAGKSSFINSADTVLQGEITGRALADGNLSEGTFTKKYKNYRFTRQSDPNNYYCVSFNDIVGLEKSRGTHVDDIILALKGHVRDGYEFNPSSPLKEGDEGYNPSPNLQDRVHVLVSVIPADGAVIITDEMVKKMRKIRRAASDMEIPQLAIITKGDKACPAVKDNVENLYKSKYLKEKVDGLCVRLEIPSHCVFLVKNYDKETSPKDDVDAPILCALTQIISVGDDFLNDKTRAVIGQTFSQPWREMPANNRENLDFVKTYQPRNADVQHLRVLLHGPVGAGKSSFINSVDTVLQGEIAGRALADGNLSEGTFTKKYKNYRFTRQSDPNNYYCVSINDIVGLEKSRGTRVDDIILALKGHVRDGYEFNPSSPLKEGDEGYNPSPNLQDRVHVMVSVIPADGAVIITDEMVKKMRKIRRAASDMGIPQLAIITKGDKACPTVKDNVENLYKSKYLKEKVDELCVTLGIPLNCIFLVKNYDVVPNIKDNVDAPILCALRQIISFGERFLNDQQNNM